MIIWVFMFKTRDERGGGLSKGGRCLLLLLLRVLLVILLVILLVVVLLLIALALALVFVMRTPELWH